MSEGGTPGSWAIEFPLGRGDAVARLGDVLRRRTGAAADQLRAFLTRIEECASPAQLRAVLRSVVARLKHERAEAPDTIDPAALEFEAICRQILESGERTSIENYGEYLFAIDVEIRI